MPKRRTRDISIATLDDTESIYEATRIGGWWDQMLCWSSDYPRVEAAVAVLAIVLFCATVYVVIS